MANLSSKHKPILRIVVLSIVGLITLIVLFIVATILLSPVFDALDRTKFEEMNSQTKDIYRALQSASGGSEVWVYTAKCDAEHSGDWPTGKYQCQTRASLTLDAISSSQLLELHKKYYAVIEGSSTLQSSGQLDEERPGAFGVSFVVSSAEKQYQMVNGGERCDYIAELTQAYDLTHDYNASYGSRIEPGGKVVISLTCTAIANENWYEFSH